MILTRIAMGEEPAPGQDTTGREAVMWVIKIRAELGYSNGVFRHKGDPLIRWGNKTSIATEGINTDQIAPVGAAEAQYQSQGPLFNPATLTGNLRAMLSPDDSQIAEFQAAYQIALRIAPASIHSMPVNMQGYDLFASPEVSVPNQLHYALGEPSVNFVQGGNVFHDYFPGDNIYLGLVKCEDVLKTSPNYELSGEPTRSVVSDYTCPPGY